ncbi:hypothetical protein JL101_027700 [Skermanella rosea]|uniref:Lipoprotein n=1 Tax=Skermanella cutis TaxID=2775420 RepID=A0ABX7B618_9PROT|nr:MULTISPECIES: hypothetical protein [Skermanella]QQP89543.1 hypothetical protein IGS68_26845 [Skermanella sp. TT6]UEM03688.1 hypothetical protein JL101_027700 [Skermanella rosea]
MPEDNQQMAVQELDRAYVDLRDLDAQLADPQAKRNAVLKCENEAWARIRSEEDLPPGWNLTGPLNGENEQPRSFRLDGPGGVTAVIYDATGNVVTSYRRAAAAVRAMAAIN